MSDAKETNNKQFSNWLQSVQSLEDAKASLGQHVLEVWTKRLMEWKKDVRNSIPTFLGCVADNKIKYIKRKWDCVCGHKCCATILNDLLSIQQNPGPGIVWNSSLSEKIGKGNFDFQTQQKSKTDGTENILRLEATTNLNLVWRLISAPFQLLKTDSRKDNFEDIFKGCKEEHVWCIANMFMQRGKAKSNVENTGPDNTDAAMFFRMMQNCRLFEIEDEHYLYDDIQKCRDKLHHSANNRIQREEAVTYLDNMTALLKKFENVQKCKDAITKIQKIRDDTVLCISMPDINIREMAKRILPLKKSALEVDIEINQDKELTDLYKETNVELESIDDPEKSFEEKVSDDSKAKDKKQGIELKLRLIQTAMDNKQNAENIDKLLDQVIEDVSNADPDFQKKAQNFSMHEGTDNKTFIGTSTEKKKSLRLIHEPTSVTTVSVPGISTSCDDEVLSEKENDCYITGFCRLPSGEILLVDFSNLRVVKLNNEFQVKDVCSNFSEKPWDVCYHGNNEAVVSVYRSLTFIDVDSMTITRSADTEHVCTGVTCHGNLLYVLGSDCVYLYNTESLKQRVLYTDKDTYFFHFVVSNDGSMIYITAMTELITIDNSGNRLYRLTDPNFRLLAGVCVDSKGHVLLCDRYSGRILQISSDGRHVNGIIAENIPSTSDLLTINFDTQTSMVICGGKSDILTAFQFKECDI